MKDLERRVRVYGHPVLKATLESLSPSVVGVKHGAESS